VAESAGPDFQLWDRRVVLCFAAINVLNAAAFFSIGKGTAMIHEPVRLAIIAAGTLLGFLLLLPAYLSIRWGFVLQLVLFAGSLSMFGLNLAARRPGITPPNPLYFATVIAEKISGLLFCCYIIWRLLNWSRQKSATPA
jgi:hypothetical protein